MLLLSLLVIYAGNLNVIGTGWEVHHLIGWQMFKRLLGHQSFDVNIRYKALAIVSAAAR
jgi:hypothetical protein